jgi:hypothetical protein
MIKKTLSVKEFSELKGLSPQAVRYVLRNKPEELDIEGKPVRIIWNKKSKTWKPKRSKTA